MSTKKSPPNRIRLTISVSPEVHQAYTRLSKATGKSLGLEMGEFLDATLDTVHFTASKIEDLRGVPGAAMGALSSYAEGLAGGLSKLLSEVQAWDGKDRPDALAFGRTAAEPPACNTGVTSPQGTGSGTSHARPVQGRAQPTARSITQKSKPPSDASGFSKQTLKDLKAFEKRQRQGKA